MSLQSVREGGKVVSPTHQPTLTPGNIAGTHFCQRLSQPHDRSEARRNMSMKCSNIFRLCQKNFTVTFHMQLKTKKEEIHVNLKQEYFTLYHREFSVSVSLFSLPLLFLFFLLYFFLSLSSFLSPLVRVWERGFPLFRNSQT